MGTSKARLGKRLITPVRSLISRGVRRDTIWLLSAQAVALAATFLATPIELHRMGAERYGIFVVLSSAAGFVSLFDFGAAYSVMRFVPWHYARGDTAAAQRVVISALLISVIVGTAVAVAVLALASPLASLLDISPRAGPDTAEALRITAAFIPVMLMSTVFSGLGRAVDMFPLAGSISAGQVIALNVVWVAVAGNRHDIVELALAQVAIGCGLIVIAAVCIKVRRGWALRAVRPRRASLREIFSFGARTSAGQAGLGLLTSADKPMLGAILPLSALPIYSIPFAFAVRITMVPSSMSSAILPPLVAALARGASDELARLRQRAFSVVGLISGLLVMNCVFGGKPLLAIWVGGGFAERAWPAFAVFGIGFGVLACGFVGTVLLDAAGQPGTSAKLMGAGAAVGLASAACAAAVWQTPVAASGGTTIGLIVIGLGGVEFARRLVVPVGRITIIRIIFNAWLPLAVAGGLARLTCGITGAPSGVTLGAVVCVTGSVALLIAYRPAAFNLGALRSRFVGVGSSGEGA